MGARVGIDEKRLEQVDAYFDRHGGKTILIGRFIGLVRALAPFIAGSSGMRYRAFVPYSILGTGLWATGLTLAGYFSSRSLDKIAAIVGRGLLLFGITVAVIVGLALLVRFLREPANRKKLVKAMDDNRLLHPLVVLGRRFRPQAEFVGRRLTPGGPLGLEVTSLLAAAAVGLYVLIAYWIVVSGNPGPDPRRYHGDGHRREHPHRLAHLNRQGDHVAGIDLGPRSARHRLGGGARGEAPLAGALRAADRRRDHLCLDAADQEHRRSAAAAGRAWSAPPALVSRAATPPIRCSTPGSG